MGEIFWHFIIGFIVSFLGSIPLGTVNLAVIQTTINVNLRAGIYFALGATLIELIYSTVAIKFIAVLLKNPHIELIIQIISIPAFIILGIIYLKKEGNEKIENQKKRRSFFNGLIVGLINPLQIPFWIAYGSLLLNNGVIKNQNSLLNVFIFGICIGTLVILFLIALASKKIIDRVAVQNKIVNRAIGIILLLIAVYQVIIVLYHFIKNGEH